MRDVRSLSLDLTSVAHALADGLSPRDLLALSYERIERAEHPHVLTYTVPRRVALAAVEANESRPDARALPLRGATFVVKDNIDVAHMPTTAACPAFSYTPTRSAPVVQRLLDAGAICVGKANMDQFATGLVGTRSPYGACRNVFSAAHVSGGSSSGSGVAVAAGWVSFSLGTDTAGSGRVPAALNNIVGLKPTPGMLSTAGVVPACRSLDCVSVFALTCGDAQRVRDVMRVGGNAPVFDAAPGFVYGVPHIEAQAWPDASAHALYVRALEQLDALGGRRVPIDWNPFAEAGELLYGPWVAERAAGVGDFVRAHRGECLPVIVDIFQSADRYSAVDAFAALARLDELREQAARQWRGVDLIVLPTTLSIPRIVDVEAEPRATNDRLGVYTRFANLLRCAVTAVPAGMAEDGLPFGVSLVAPAERDHVLDAIAPRLHARSSITMGATGHALPDVPIASASSTESLPIAVVGAHLSGMPLNPQLTQRGAVLLRATTTAAHYRLYALPNTTPRKPGLLRVGHDGAAIEVELWRMPLSQWGAFIAQVPPPLVIGNVELADGAIVKGFLCEPHALQGAEDITRFGGFRRYLASIG